MHKNTIHRNGRIYILTMTALMAAVLCVLSPIALPIGPVPVTLCTLLIYLSQYLLGWKQGTISCLIYILLGLMGLPVFAGFMGGIGKLLGPTGGYLVGYLAVALCTGLAVENSSKRGIHALGMMLGTMLCYTLGTAWYCLLTNCGVKSALLLCVIPFLPGDFLKILAALVFGPLLHTRLKQAGLLP